MSSRIGCAERCANISASMTSASLASAAPPSTITMASFEHATIMSRSACACCSNVGKITNSPLMRATRMPASGPLQGMSERCTAALAPVSAMTSVGFTLSDERTVAMICVSFLKPSGKSGTHRPIDDAAT